MVEGAYDEIVSLIRLTGVSESLNLQLYFPEGARDEFSALNDFFDSERTSWFSVHLVDGLLVYYLIIYSDHHRAFLIGIGSNLGRIDD
jgi:hypothetical protein